MSKKEKTIGDFLINSFQRYLVGYTTTLLALCATVTTIVSPSHALDPIEGKSIVESKQATAQQNQTPVQLGWNGLNIQMPTQITWTSSKVTVRDAEQRACVAVGSDDRGPVELILVELNGYFAATFTDGSGVRWSARNTVGQPIVFTQVAAKDADFPRETLTPSPELVNRWQKQQAAGQASNEGGIAGNCQDTDTIDVLVVYTACALYQSGGLGPLLADIFLGETITNTAFDNSAINTAGTFRQVRIVAVQPTPLYPFPCGVGQAGCLPDPTEPICGSDGTFGDDLTAISDINTPLGGAVGQMRDYHDADLVLMLRVGAGVLAFQKLVNAGCVSNQAFAVIGQGSLGIGSTAMTYGIGLLCGCCQAPGDDGSCWEGAMFPYSSGHRFVGDNQIQYRTIMTLYPGNPITYFSNPDVTFNNAPTGTTESGQGSLSYWSDNAQTIRETYDDVRCYRCRELPPLPLPQGDVRCFGRNNYGQTEVPEDLAKCIKVAAGSSHTVALEFDGTVKAWGAGTTDTQLSPNWGQSIVPVYMPVPPNGDGQLLGSCREIAAGLYHTVAIRSREITDPTFNLDGTVVVWGQNLYGQRNVPANLGACKQIAAGEYHTVALRRDGIVRAWGAGSVSGAGDYPNADQSVVPANLGACSRIAAGGYHTVALRLATGTGSNVVAWGAGTTAPPGGGGYGLNWGQSFVSTQQLGSCIDIAAGKYHTLALKSDGTVAAWGAGTTSAGPTPKYGQSIVPASLGICTKLAAGGYHSLAIKADEKMGNWGAGLTNTQISPNYGQSIPVPTDITWIEISAGEFHTVAIQNNAALLPCAGDFNNDGRRDGLDMTTLLSGWGTANGDCNGDGTTNGLDISYLLSGWGFCQ